MAIFGFLVWVFGSGFWFGFLVWVFSVGESGMLRTLFVVLASSVALVGHGHATTFIFEGNGGQFDTPTGNIAQDCGSIGVDLCTCLLYTSPSPRDS